MKSLQIVHELNKKRQKLWDFSLFSIQFEEFFYYTIAFRSSQTSTEHENLLFLNIILKDIYFNPRSLSKI